MKRSTFLKSLAAAAAIPFLPKIAEPIFRNGKQIGSVLPVNTIEVPDLSVSKVVIGGREFFYAKGIEDAADRFLINFELGLFKMGKVN